MDEASDRAAAPPDPAGFARWLGRRIDASPTPYHAAEEAAAVLVGHGFRPLDLTAAWSGDDVDRAFVHRGGAVVAWVVPGSAPPSAPIDLVGAHTDSPGLRVRPQPDVGAAGWRQLGVEVYGGALVNSWLDRDLGLAGRVTVQPGDGSGALQERLVRVDQAIARIPQLAIHLDREVTSQGLKLNPQQHLTPVWGVGAVDRGGFARFLAKEVGVEAEQVLAWDVALFDLVPAALLGADQALLSAGRLDDLCCSFAAIEALAGVGHGRTAPGRSVAMVSLHDHEEVGSTSANGADGSLLAQVVERVVLARGGGREDVLRALADSRCASADMAHATHPNYPERHEPSHPIEVNAGPVVKANANQRYATEAATAAAFEVACTEAGVPVQRYSHRGDMPCGSTIGPITAARLGIPTVDVGVAQLSMHSVRELCGADDPAALRDALRRWLDGAGR